MASNYEQEQRFSLKHFPSLARAAAVGWNKDDPWRLSAVIVYYAILSLPGLLVMSFVISATLSALQDVIASKDISVDWGALFTRRLLAKVNLDSMVINYVAFEEVVEEEVEKIDIVKELQDLIDFSVDVTVTNSTLNFADGTNDPHIEFSLTGITLEARYLTNEVHPEDTLPATVNLKASAMGTGRIDAKVRIDYMKDVPDFDFEMELVEIDITEFNDLLEAYAGFEAHQGLIYVYSEAAAHNGEMKGYVKPVLDEIEITPVEDDANKFQEFYESVLDVIASVLESPDDKEHISTRVEFEGRIDDPEVDVWQAVWNLLRNAFVEGFSKELDQNIDFEDLTD